MKGAIEQIFGRNKEHMNKAGRNRGEYRFPGQNHGIILPLFPGGAVRPSHRKPGGMARKQKPPRPKLRRAKQFVGSLRHRTKKVRAEQRRARRSGVPVSKTAK